MTDRAQFEAMLEALINDDQQSAKEIFHNIVVGKSREIYEELLAEDFSQDSGNPYSKQDEGMEEEESMEEEMEEEGAEEESMEEEGAEEESDDEESDDKEGDDADDSEDDPFGDEEGGEGDEDLEDRVMDLEDALEDLKAEFEQLLAGEEGEEHMGSDDMGMEPEMGGMDDMGGMDEEEMPMMEYVNKVPAPKHGDNGTNTRSLIDNMKNDMGGSNKNIAQNFSTTSGGTQGGLASPKAGDLTAGLNVHNRPGSDAGKTGFKKQVKGGGIDRQAGFNNPNGQVAGAGTGAVSRDGEKNTRSLIGKRVK